MSNPDAPAWALWLESTGLGEVMRGSSWLYPTANVTHVLAMALLVGSLVALDLRLLGLAPRIDVQALNRYLSCIACQALPLVLLSGFTVFAADASHVAVNPVFWVKMGLLAAALLNAGLFTLLWRQRLLTWDFDAPPAARAQALLSLVLWLAVPIAGRLLAYF